MQHKSRESRHAEKLFRKLTLLLMFQFADWVVPVPNTTENNQTFCDNRATLFLVPELPLRDTP